MSEYDRLKAQKDAIVAREREAIEQPLRDRIATLEAQLVEVTAERDAANDKALRVVRGEFAQICSYCGWEANRNGAQWEELQAHVRVCPAHPMRVVEKERDSLRTALRQVAEAETNLRDHWLTCEECQDCDTPCEANIELQGKLTDALALPVVQAILERN